MDEPGDYQCNCTEFWTGKNCTEPGAYFKIVCRILQVDHGNGMKLAKKICYRTIFERGEILKNHVTPLN